MSGASEGYRADIDGLRAIAVLSVIAYHAFPEHVRGGFVGVDVFFVISGFLISTIIIREIGQGTFSIATFYGRRIRRLFPALVLVLAACMAVGWSTLWTLDLHQLGKHVVTASLFLSNIQLWKETGYFDAASDSKPLLHLWSLGVEEQFYLAWPLVAAWLVKARRRLGLWVGVFILVSFALNIALTARSPLAAFFLPVGRFWELMAGAGLATLSSTRLQGMGRGIRDAASMVGALALFSGVLLLQPGFRFPGWWALVPVLGATLIIWAGPEAFFNRCVLACRPLVWIGLISYPLYLWHWPVLTFARLTSLDPLTVAERTVAIAASFVLAALTYRFVERPIRRSTGHRTAPSLGVAMATLGAAGFAVWISGGVASRFPAHTHEIGRYSLMSDEISASWRRHRCMLEGEASYADECIQAAPKSSPSVLLWGDSHAAALYPGLKGLQERFDFRLTQFTSSVCPPAVGYEHPNERYFKRSCVALNEHVRRKFMAEPPDMAILAGYWGVYEGLDVAQTVALLRDAGVRKVVVVGDVPAWTQNPAKVLFRLSMEFPDRHVPLRVSKARFIDVSSPEAGLASSVRAAGAEFVSLRELMCDPESCMSFTRDGMAFADPDHLAPPGAGVVAGMAFARLLESMVRPSTK